MDRPNCEGVRMLCRFTVPIGKFSRFRSYRCAQCKHYEETYETSTLLLPPTEAEVRALRAGIDKAKATRFRFTRQDKKIAPTTASGELSSEW